MDAITNGTSSVLQLQAGLFAIIISVIIYLLVAKAPEVAFGLFLVAGFYKADPRFQLPYGIDMTVLLGLVTVAGIGVQTLKRDFRLCRLPKQLWVPYLGLILLMLGSLLYTSSPAYGIDKFLRFSTLTTLACFGPNFLMRSPARMNRFFFTLIMMSVAGVVDALVSTTNSLVRTAFGSNYLALGRLTGLAAILAIFYFSQVAETRIYKLSWTAVGVINLVGLLFSGGRGPVVGFTSSVMLLVFILATGTWSSRSARRMLVLTGSVAILVTILLAVNPGGLFSGTMARFEVLVDEPGWGTSASARLVRYMEALNSVAEAPLLGVGVGGFSFYAEGIDARYYPHNIFLEVLSELGLFGLILLVSLMILCFRELLGGIGRRQNINGYHLNLVLLLSLIFMVVNASVSGDLNDNRLLFAMIGTGFASASFTRRASPGANSPAESSSLRI